MKKVVALILTVFCLFALTACGGSEAGTLKIISLGEYMSQDVLDQFTEETGIEILYDEAPTSEEIYTKYMSGGLDYDLICISDYMIEKLISDGELAEINFDNVPNIANIDELYLESSQAFDPENKYSIPYFWGTLGILYNTEMVEEPITSWADMWDERYAGKIIMMSSIRDTFAAALARLGYSLNTTDEAELQEALQLLIDQKPLVMSYLVDEARDEMILESAAMTMMYSGEAYYAMEYNDKLAFCVPEEGSNIWIDSYVITKRCDNKENAEKFLNFICREDIATQLFEEVMYATPNKVVYDNIEDEELKNEEALFPQDESVKRCEVFYALSDEDMELYSQLWKELKVD